MLCLFGLPASLHYSCSACLASLSLNLQVLIHQLCSNCVAVIALLYSSRSLALLHLPYPACLPALLRLTVPRRVSLLLFFLPLASFCLAWPPFTCLGIIPAYLCLDPLAPRDHSALLFQVFLLASSWCALSSLARLMRVLIFKYSLPALRVPPAVTRLTVHRRL